MKNFKTRNPNPKIKRKSMLEEAKGEGFGRYLSYRFTTKVRFLSNFHAVWARERFVESEGWGRAMNERHESLRVRKSFLRSSARLRERFVEIGFLTRET